VRLQTPSQVQGLVGAGARYGGHAAVIHTLLIAASSATGIAQHTLKERFAAASSLDHPEAFTVCATATVVQHAATTVHFRVVRN
jgi:predicted transcriptional regulator with HTH domain